MGCPSLDPYAPPLLLVTRSAKQPRKALATLTTATPQRLYLMQIASLPPPDNTPAVCMDGDGTRASTRKLVDLAERVGAALVIFGHDGAQWQALKLAPDYYG